MKTRSITNWLVAPSIMVAALSVPSTVVAQEMTLVLEKSKIEFVGSKAEGDHKGGFKKFEAASIADFENPGNSSLTVRIDATSIWSDDDKLTNHLKSPDFFGVRNHPKIVFESSSIMPSEPVDGVAKVTIKGDFEMLGKTVPIEIPCEATITDDMVELDCDFTIDRTKWGMTYGEGKIKNEVKIVANLIFKR